MINWGIIGLGNIASRFVKGLSYSEVGKLYAVASQTKEKREQFKSKDDVIVYSSYDDLLNDENVDVVYIALPHKFHYEWAKKALLKYKAVLCEKPVTLSLEELDDLIRISKEQDTFFMEAMKSRFIPMSREIKKIVDNGVLGDVKRIENAFCFEAAYNKNSYLYDISQGGSLYDCGIYNIAAILQFIHSPVVSIDSVYKMEHGVDVDDHIELTFESGQTAFMECSMIQNKPKLMRIIGSKGVLECDPFYRPTKAVVHFNNGESFTGIKEYDFDDFYSEIEEVHHCLAYIKIESDLMSHEDSRKCIELMLKIKERLI